MKNKILLLFILQFTCNIFAQDDLEGLLSPLPQQTKTINTFKSTRIINNHSVELFGKNQLDLRIAHRFGFLNTGLYELYGLDQAKIRLGLEYGLMKNIMIGLGRSTYNKTYDGYIKCLLLNQTNGENNTPFTVVLFSNIAINSLKKNINPPTLDNSQNYNFDYPFLGRLSYCNQLLIASKITRELSLQIMPTWVHWNMVEFAEQKNQHFIIGAGIRYLLTNSLSINSEYFYRINPSEFDYATYFNSFSIGVDIETGGHVFQLHVTNSLPMHESAFLTRTQGSWLEGGVHFGFNISREFNL